MGLKCANYIEVMGRIQTGDVIAFSGTTYVDEIIKLSTYSQISHVAVVLKSYNLEEKKYEKGDINKIVEVRPQVMINDLRERIERSNDQIWWLPLREDLRVDMNVEKLYNFVLKQQGKKFNLLQAIKSKIDFFDKFPFFLLKNLTYNSEDFSKVFCSQFVAATLKECGVMKDINTSEATPSDVCMFNIYSQDYYQIKGKCQVIKEYNTISPFNWGY